MQSIFEKNLDAWEKRFPDTKKFLNEKYIELSNNENDEIFVEQDSSGKPILVVKRSENNRK